MRVLLASALVTGFLGASTPPSCDPLVSEEILSSSPECEGLMPPRPKSHLTDRFTLPARISA